MTEEYIIDATNYLPEFLQESEIMLSVVDCLNVLLSKETSFFAQIFEAYTDSIYKTRNYFKLSTAAKIAIIEELGFDYLLDIVPLTDDQLSKLLIFFNLVYMLKGREEGLEICLRALGINHFTYTTWDNQSPMGAPFTALLTIVGTHYNNDTVLGKLKNFLRCYMLPLIDVVIVVEVEGAPIYIYPSAGFLMREKHYLENEAIRDILEGYAEIATGPDQVTPKYKGSVQLQFSVPKGYFFKINDKEYTYSIPNYTTTELGIDKVATNGNILVGFKYDTGKLYYNEGTEWVENGSVSGISLLKYVKDKFYLIAENVCRYSEDGKTWTTFQPTFIHTLSDGTEVELTSKINDIIYTSNQYVAVAGNGIGYQSEDGIEWEGFLIEPYYEKQIIKTDTQLYGWVNEDLSTLLDITNLYTNQISTYTGTTLSLVNETNENITYNDQVVTVSVQTEETEEGLSPKYVVTIDEVEYILTRDETLDFVYTKETVIPAQTRNGYNFNRVGVVNNNIHALCYSANPIYYTSYDLDTWTSHSSALQVLDETPDYLHSELVTLGQHLLISMSGLGLYDIYNNSVSRQGEYVNQLRYLDNKLQGFRDDLLIYFSEMSYSSYGSSYIYTNSTDVGLPQEGTVTDITYFNEYYRVFQTIPATEEEEDPTYIIYNLFPVREQILFINEDDGLPYTIIKTVNIGEYVTYEMGKEGYLSYINICAPMYNETITLPDSLEPEPEEFDI